jgi:LAO/AO transport system kinase
MTILEKFYRGDQAALSRIISFIEDREEGFRRLLSEIYPRSGRALKFGFTGPPGAGKSSLVNNIAKKLAVDGKRVAIIAVDPTSPFTGGALLGDRIRLTDMPTDGSIYIRSMATRGSTGGLAAASNNVATALDAFGYDFILFETVGVGQVELDIVDACDAVVVVLVPESGDAIQALKAGLMEIANIFAVNKADRPGSDNFISQLNMILDIKREHSDWPLPVVDTVAIKDLNTDVLMEKVDEFIEYKKETGLFLQHRREQIKKKIYNIMMFHLNHRLQEDINTTVDIEEVVSKIVDGENDPFHAAAELLKLSGLNRSDNKL